MDEVTIENADIRTVRVCPRRGSEHPGTVDLSIRVPLNSVWSDEASPLITDLQESGMPSTLVIRRMQAKFGAEA